MCDTTTILLFISVETYVNILIKVASKYSYE